MAVCICPDAGKDGHGYSCPYGQELRRQKPPTKRVFDDPSHPQYGPVRRMWVVMAQLDMLEDAERYNQYTKRMGGVSWDDTLAEMVKQRGEARAQRAMLLTILKNWSS